MNRWCEWILSHWYLYFVTGSFSSLKSVAIISTAERSKFGAGICGNDFVDFSGLFWLKLKLVPVLSDFVLQILRL